MKRLSIGILIAVSATFFVLGGCVSENEEGEIALSSECTWYGGVECEAECETTEFDFYCEGGCNGNISLPDCQLDCEGSCTADCELDPGSFSCEGYCGGECGASCSGDCEASSDSASCQGECEAYCQGECTASCEGTPPSASCEAGCEASCEGGCSGGDLDFDCYFDCQIESPIDCQGSCDAEGFYECNGEFINSGDVEEAIDWIEANMPEVEITFEGDASCAGNTCEAEGSCAMNCAVGSPSGKGSSRGLLLVLIFFGAFIIYRRLS